MLQRFTERSHKVVFYAQEEAGRFGHNHVSTEHLLLGLVRENDNVAARILDRIGVPLKRIRLEVEARAERGEAKIGQDMQLMPRAKRVIDLAFDEARLLNNNYIGTEHLLLGIIREGEGVAGQVLSKLGVTLNEIREEVRHLQEGNLANNTQQADDTPDDPKAAEKKALVEHLHGVLTALRANWTTGAGESGEEAVARLRSEDVSLMSVAYTLLQHTAREAGSSVFIEPSRHLNELRLQFSGGDELKIVLPRTLYLPFLARFKVMAQTPPGPERVLRQGSVFVQSGDIDYQISLGFAPTEHGETIVIHSAEPVQTDPA